MIADLVQRGRTSNIGIVFIPDSASAVGAGKTGLTFASAGLSISVRRALSAAATTYTSAGSTIETITTLGTFAAPTATKCRFKEIDATAQPGMYEIHVDDTICSASDGSRFLSGMVLVTGGAPSPFLVQFSAIDVQDVVRMALTALPNAAAQAAGGLYTRGTGAGQIRQVADGLIDVNLMRWLDTAAATPTVAGVPEVDLTHWLGTAAATPTVAGVPEVDVTHVGGTAQTAGDLAALIVTATGFIDSEITDIRNRLPAALTADGLMKADTLRVGGTLQTAGDLAAILATIDDFLDTESAVWTADLDDIQARVTDLQARTPAALVGGRTDASVGAMAANVMTATAAAADFGTEIGAAVVATVVEPQESVTLKQATAVMLAIIGGRSDGAGTYKTRDNAVTRAVFTVAGGARTASTWTLP